MNQDLVQSDNLRGPQKRSLPCKSRFTWLINLADRLAQKAEFEHRWGWRPGLIAFMIWPLKTVFPDAYENALPASCGGTGGVPWARPVDFLEKSGVLL
jgi:hypothetical protein